MSEQHSAFHWPDHAIGKRESRRIRNEHNALYNEYHELLDLLVELVNSPNRKSNDLWERTYCKVREIDPDRVVVYRGDPQ